MLSNSVQAFNDKVAADPALRIKIRSITSPLDFLALAKSEGLDLSGQDFQILVQQAYQQWIEQLDPKMSGLFSQIHGKKELDDLSGRQVAYNADKTSLIALKPC